MSETEKWKMVFGFLLLVLIASLGAIIALGRVEAQSSFGLEQILGGLLVLAGGFAHWAFGEYRSSIQEESHEAPPQ